MWGIAGPADQVLAGQFCRPMTSVDGGCVIQFLCQAWNPDSPQIHTTEWARKIGHVQQRFAELALERELPSWRDGVQKEFFKVDMRKSVNWSHIDLEPGDEKDWLDWGSNNDLRHMPRGDVQFEEVPFHVIEPEKNGGKSIVMLTAESEGHFSVLPQRSSRIPVGRRAASLIFLRTNIGGGYLPGYRVTYEGDRYLTAELDAMGNSSRGYACYGLYQPGTESRPPTPNDVHYNSKGLYNQMTNYFSLFFRLAWLGTTGAGDPLKVTMHEWVNPYPELTIKSVSVETPVGRGKNRLEVLFAVTGIAPVQRDFDLWKDRKRLPLALENEVELEEGDTPVITDEGVWDIDPELGMSNPSVEYKYHDEEEKLICTVKGVGRGDDKFTNNAYLFKKKDRAWLGNGGVLKLASPQVCKKVAFRTQFYWEFHGRRVVYGVTSFRRTDYVIEVSADGKAWTKVGEKQGVCGEDGDQVHRLPATPIQYVRIKLSGRDKYVTERSFVYSYGPGVSWLQLYK